MRISVIIPAYNAENTIDKNIAALLSQTRLPDEIIVIDNNSHDGTVRSVEKQMSKNYPLKMILDKETKSGPSAARNRGVMLSSGDVVAFIDADEVPPGNWVEIIYREFNRGSEVVYGPVTEADRKTFLKKYLDIMEKANLGERQEFKPGVRNNNFLYAGNLAIKKDLFYKTGRFNESMHLGEDIDLSKRIYRLGRPIVYNPELAAVHYHKESIKGRIGKGFSYGMLQAKFLKEYFDRGINIVYSKSKSVSFKFPIKIRIQFFSILNALIFCILVNFYNSTAALLAFILLIMGINLKILNLVNKASGKLDPLNYVLFFLYWSLERLVFDFGRIFGSIKYGVICI